MTWELAGAVVTLLLLMYYSYFVLSARRGLLNLRSLPSSFEPQVSVVIAARNEGRTIADCLHSVLNQDYPSNKVEVVLVDDASTDETARIASSIAQADKRLKVLTMPPGNADGHSRKPQVLAMGIRLSSGEIILTTDGDCVVPPTWIRSMVKSFDEHTVFVAGPVRELPSSELISRLSQLEFLGLVGISAGLIANKTPIICNGANVAFRRTAFEAARGYGESGFCDDEVLMQRISARRLGTIGYSAEEESVVSTGAPATFRAFWNQRIRWASKRGHYEDRWIFLKLMGLYLFFVTLLAFGFISLFFVSMLPLAAGLFAIKIAVDYQLLSATAKRFGQAIRLDEFVIAEVFHVPYIVTAAFAGQFSEIEWKGKQIRA